MRNPMKRIVQSTLSLGLALCLLAAGTSCGGKPEPTDPIETTGTAGSLTETAGTMPLEPEPEVPDDFLPVLRFAVCSDLHISTIKDEDAKRFANLTKAAYRYANSQTYQNLDALVICGDMTNGGEESELEVIKKLFRNVRDGTEIITIMGNHEHNVGGPEAYTKFLDPELRKHRVINGFHFIAASPDEGRDDYSEDTCRWLAEELAAAALDAPGQPIFTFRHHHLQNTVYVSKSWYTPSSERLRAVMDPYPQIVDFSGDSHGPMNTPSALWQGTFTALNTGTLAYIELEYGMTDGTVPAGAFDAQQFYIVEADANNSVVILPYDLAADDFFRTPSNTDDPEKQLVYYIENPADPASFRYTAEERTARSSAPYFGEGAAVSVEHIDYTGAAITIPQAFDDSCVYSYTLELTGSDGSTHTYKYFSGYYYEPMQDTVLYTPTDLAPGTTYTVNVYPVNVWDKVGKPITTEFTTRTFTPAPYTSVNPVNFLGTFTNFDSQKDLTWSDGNVVFGGSVTGDVLAAEDNSAAPTTDVSLTISENGGYKDSPALAVSLDRDGRANRTIYVFATEENGNVSRFGEADYFRVWADFTGVDFRKADFGFVAANGMLYSTDDANGRYDQEFYCLPDGSDTWEMKMLGNDGGFGLEQDSSMADFRGWLAFPLRHFSARDGSGARVDTAYGCDVSGVYFFFDLADDSMLGKPFLLDEIGFVGDYQVFID